MTTFKVEVSENVSASIETGYAFFLIQTGFRDETSHYVKFYENGTCETNKGCDTDLVAKVFWQCVAQEKLRQGRIGGRDPWITFNESSISIMNDNSINFNGVYEPDKKAADIWRKIADYSGLEPEYRKTLEVVTE